MPTLVAAVDDEEAFAFIEQVARKNGVIYLALAAPPAARQLHALQVRGPNGRNVLSLLAEVMGPVTEKGAPLRLRYPPRGSAPPSDKPTYQSDDEAPVELEELEELPGDGDAHIGRSLSAGKLVIEHCVGIG